MLDTLTRESFWAGVLSGILTWVLGSLVWTVIFEPALKKRGLLNG